MHHDSKLIPIQIINNLKTNNNCSDHQKINMTLINVQTIQNNRVSILTKMLYIFIFYYSSRDQGLFFKTLTLTKKNTPHLTEFRIY